MAKAVGCVRFYWALNTCETLRRGVASEGLPGGLCWLWFQLRYRLEVILVSRGGFESTGAVFAGFD